MEITFISDLKTLWNKKHWKKFINNISFNWHGGTLVHDQSQGQIFAFIITFTLLAIKWSQSLPYSIDVDSQSKQALSQLSWTFGMFHSLTFYEKKSRSLSLRTVGSNCTRPEWGGVLPQRQWDAVLSPWLVTHYPPRGAVTPQLLVWTNTYR